MGRCFECWITARLSGTSLPHFPEESEHTTKKTLSPTRRIMVFVRFGTGRKGGPNPHRRLRPNSVALTPTPTSWLIRGPTRRSNGSV